MMLARHCDSHLGSEGYNEMGDNDEVDQYTSTPHAAFAQLDISFNIRGRVSLLTSNIRRTLGEPSTDRCKNIVEKHPRMSLDSRNFINDLCTTTTTSGSSMPGGGRCSMRLNFWQSQTHPLLKLRLVRTSYRPDYNIADLL